MPTGIEFSHHSLLKIEILKSHGIDVSKEIFENVLKNPDKIEKSYKERLVAQKGFDETHVLRVVYEESPEKKYIITVYPGRHPIRSQERNWWVCRKVFHTIFNFQRASRSLTI